jgi:hypothetical protein
MRLPLRARDIPGRLAAGAFILNSGLSKRDVPQERATGMHGMAKGTYPFLSSWDPTSFVRTLSKTEIALGALLLTPVVPTAVAGAALTGFAGGLLGLYLRTPGMRKPGSLAPSEQGLTISKDVWLLGIGLGLLVDGLSRNGD